MHIKAARRAGNVTVAKFIDALDVFPANASRRHRIVRRLGLGAIQCEQRRCDVISIGWLGKIVDRANLHGLDRGRDIAVTGENDMASDRRCFNAVSGAQLGIGTGTGAPALISRPPSS